MNVLFLTQILPYPPDAGPRVKTWQLLRYLVESGHDVTLLAFVREDERVHLPVVEAQCKKVVAVPIKRSRLSDIFYLLKSQFSGRPFLVERDDLAKMRGAVRAELNQQHFDILHADQLTMTVFIQNIARSDEGTAVVRIFDAHNAVWTIVDRMRRNSQWFLRPVMALETQRVRRYEGQIVADFEHTLAVTENDRTALLAAAPQGAQAITVLPIAVDTSALPVAERKSSSRAIVTLGTLHYPPNADGIRWFVEDVYPLIREAVPDTSMTIIGKNPPADFVRLAARPELNIQVPGFVPVLEPYLDRAALMVVPVRAGGGMRVRILEAFARGMPVVTTTVGLEGIQAVPGQDVEVHDTAAAFAEAVIALLNDPERQQRLAERGRRLAQERYDRQVVLRRVDELYRELQGGNS